MEQLVGAIERASRVVKDIGETVETIGSIAEGFADKFQIKFDKSRQAGKEFEESVKNAAKHFDVIDKVLEKAVSYQKKLNDQLTESAKKWGAIGSIIKMHGMAARGPVGLAGGNYGLGMSGSRGILGTLQSTASSIMMKLPMGGLLGVMLYGAIREEGFRAQTAGIMRQMDRIAGYTKSQARGVNAELRAHFAGWKSDGQELTATMTKFSEFSIGENRFLKLGGNAKVAGVAVHSVATALDLVANLQPGTTAQAIGQAMENTGKSVKNLAGDFMKLRVVSKQNEVDFSSLMSTMTQSMSALRMQRQGVSDLSSAYFGLREGLRTYAGMSRDQASVAAMKGVSAIAQSIGGMNEGLMGYVAQRIQQRTGKGPSDPFEAMMALRLGQTTGGPGTDRDYMTTVVRELQKIMKESVGGSQERQIGALEKLGFPLEAAQAIIRMGSGASLKDVVLGFQDPMKLVKEAIEARSKAANQWEMKMERIMLGLAKIGVGLTTIIAAGFSSVSVGLAHFMYGNWKAAGRVLVAGATAQDKGFTQVGAGVADIRKEIGEGADTVLGGVPDINLELELFNKPPDKKGARRTRRFIKTALAPLTPHMIPSIVAGEALQTLTEKNEEEARANETAMVAARAAEAAKAISARSGGTTVGAGAEGGGVAVTNKTRGNLSIKATTLIEVGPGTATVQPERGGRG